MTNQYIIDESDPDQARLRKFVDDLFGRIATSRGCPRIPTELAMYTLGSALAQLGHTPSEDVLLDTIEMVVDGYENLVQGPCNTHTDVRSGSQAA